MGLLSSVGRPPAGAQGGSRGPETRNAPAQGARGEGRASARRSNRPPARVARDLRTFDRTRTCDDQRSWGGQQQEYAMSTRRRQRGLPHGRDHGISARLRRPWTHGGPAATCAAGPRRDPGTATLQGPRRACEAWGEGWSFYSSASMLRVRFGSTGMPGPMVVETVTFLRYRPLADDGLARRTSSRAAA